MRLRNLRHAGSHASPDVDAILIIPLADQHHIVAKVDALMALCDELEARLKERAGVQGRLAGAVVMGMAKI